MSLDTKSTKNKDVSSSVPWHTLTVEATFERLEATHDGLSSEEVARRLGQFGPNELQARERFLHLRRGRNGSLPA
ncbi:MAG: cation-transporting P-type ATPase [Acidobacteriota bacterium]